MFKWISRELSYIAVDRKGVQWRVPFDYNGCESLSDRHIRQGRSSRSLIRFEVVVEYARALVALLIGRRR